MRRRWRGFLDMGRIRIPPLPQGIVLTDRADGTLWLLSHNTTESSTDGYGYISITDTWASSVDTKTYSANGGPHIATQPTVRLLIRNGSLGYERVDYGIATTDIDQPGPYTRNGLKSETRQIIEPSDWLYPDTLGWEVIEV